MEFGIAMFITGQGGLDPAKVAISTEERGFESLFACEHGHIPILHDSVYPGEGEVPRFYAEAYDPFVSLTAAASATTTLTLGTGICLLAQRDAILTAKLVSSVDQISGGRFVFGVAAGWNREEIADHGINPADRFAILQDKLEAMKAIWTTEEAEYHGQHVNFGPMWSAPKPVQKPYPPILVGGAGPKALRTVAETADGWMPSIAREVALAERVDELQQMAADAGRPPVQVTALIPPAVLAADTEPYIERAALAGAQRTVLTIRPDPSAFVLPALDGFAAVTQRWR